MPRPSAAAERLAPALALALVSLACGGGDADVSDGPAAAVDGARPPDARASDAGASVPPDGPALADGPGGGADTSGGALDRPPPPAPDAAGGRSDAAAPAPDGPAGLDVPAPSCSVCTSWAPAELLGRIGDAPLNAVSGIAASWRNPGVLYVHNDRARAEVAAIGGTGAVLSRFTLAPAPSARDFESIEVGRCPAGTCVYLADIGNNIAPIRAELVIYRFAEPEVAPGRPGGDVAFERFAFSYPDGNHNAEAILIDPTGAVYLVTKEAAGTRSAAYRVPLDPARATVAVKVGDLPVPAAGDQPATGGSAHPCGAGFLLRTGNTLYEFRNAPGAPFEQAFRATPVMVPVGNEPQGEAVAYGPDGRSYYTTSEGASPPLHRVVCR
jgi:hypothetical protein